MILYFRREKTMELYNKELIANLNQKIDTSAYYMPDDLFRSNIFVSVRLEVKYAYVAILNTLLKSPNYTKEGIAFVKDDNPETKKILATLTNKTIDDEKMEDYIIELCNDRLIEREKHNIYVGNFD